MKYKNILLTGGSGILGSHILNSGKLENVLAPSHEDLDICNPDLVERFFQANEVDSVIHCAAIARMQECEKDPIRAAETNIFGTLNLVKEVLRAEERNRRGTRFLYISTDGVYDGKKGNYSEEDPTIPYSKYGWTKLGGECAARLHPNHCIVRTSFFDPLKINFEESPDDAYSSKLPIKNLVGAIKFLLKSNFIGTINVGGVKKSHYDLYKEFVHSLKPCKLNDIQKNLNFKFPKDSSMDISLWKKMRNNKNLELKTSI
jgi:dTDP-4-dehydrorhamnose reductase